MHIAVIGAGTGGLCAAKHALANGFQVTVFEQTGEIGGTWIYTDDVGKMDNGINIHTSMYHGLRSVNIKILNWKNLKIKYFRNIFLGRIFQKK